MFQLQTHASQVPPVTVRNEKKSDRFPMDTQSYRLYSIIKLSVTLFDPFGLLVGHYPFSIRDCNNRMKKILIGSFILLLSLKTTHFANTFAETLATSAHVIFFSFSMTDLSNSELDKSFLF